LGKFFDAMHGGIGPQATANYRDLATAFEQLAKG
jgi:hypothetical protein